MNEGQGKLITSIKMDGLAGELLGMFLEAKPEAASNRSIAGLIALRRWYLLTLRPEKAAVVKGRISYRLHGMRWR